MEGQGAGPDKSYLAGRRPEDVFNRVIKIFTIKFHFRKKFSEDMREVKITTESKRSWNLVFKKINYKDRRKWWDVCS